jgi:hypothetical protein
MADDAVDLELLLAKLEVIDTSPLTRRLLRYVLTQQRAGWPVCLAEVRVLLSCEAQSPD